MHERSKCQATVCACGRIDRFLEPCLLMLLHDRETHGYDLAGRLPHCGFRHEPSDTSLVYRCLRGMEARQLVVSEWDTGPAGGPPRRIYRLTSLGDRALADWVAYLRETGQVIQEFLAAYGRHMAEGQGNYHTIAKMEDAQP